MSGRLKEVRLRIASVKSTQQITKAMKMVAAAKLRKAQEGIVQLRPYANKLQELLSNLVAATEGDIDLSLLRERPIKNILIVLVTSDRGLCGAFNTNLVKLAKSRIAEKYTGLSQHQIHVLTVGRKGQQQFMKTPYPINKDFTHLMGAVNFEGAATLADFLMKSYENQIFDRIEIVYSRFKNAATQIFESETFLPVPKPAETTSNLQMDFIFEPDKAELVASLIPKILKTQVYKCLLDTAASEHGARMTAMDKASENANELLTSLKIQYNRARQAAITTELTEIVAGASALEG